RAREQAVAALRSMTDEIVEDQMARGPQLAEENKEFLRKIIKHYEGFAVITGDDAESRAVRAEGHLRVGDMRRRLGELKGAEVAYGEALVLARQLTTEFPDQPEFRQALARTRNNQGILFHNTGRATEAEAAWVEAIALYKRLAVDFPSRPG